MLGRRERVLQRLQKMLLEVLLEKGFGFQGVSPGASALGLLRVGETLVP